MSQADLVFDLKASLHEAASTFVHGEELTRLLSIAANDLIRVRPRILSAELTLVADVGNYVAPVDLVRVYRSHWLDRYQGKPWDVDWPGLMPRLWVGQLGGVKRLFLTHAPSARQIAALGAAYAYDYCVQHVIGVAAVDTTIDNGDRSLLLLRAQAEAMKELGIRNITKPVSLGPAGASVGNMPKNGSPAGLYELLMERFEAAA